MVAQLLIELEHFFRPGHFARSECLSENRCALLLLCLLTLRNLRVLLIDLVTSRSLALIGSLWIQSSRFDLRVDVHQLLGDVLEVWVTRHLGPAFLDLLLLNLGGESCVVPLLSHEIDQATLP